eukprot:gnl/TRDRNA2_/TRDRNA2_157984_c0_seq2.p1 gnl/TRDRNA2_/TRDRNA2_157984_c0~~gnl/TRDRNA2_/TRDRNA2_157984_c0_seq2.p1  ORF type:complete len:361 (-),score=67.37 gnl/TRDRNA2_/TRDRNA2_157984_c0_seq2:319-1329(-)
MAPDEAAARVSTEAGAAEVVAEAKAPDVPTHDRSSDGRTKEEEAAAAKSSGGGHRIIARLQLSLEQFLKGSRETEDGFLEFRSVDEVDAPAGGMRFRSLRPVSDSTTSHFSVRVKVKPTWMELEPPTFTPLARRGMAVVGALGVRVGMIEGIAAPSATVAVSAGVAVAETQPGTLLRPALLASASPEAPSGRREESRPDVDQRIAVKLKEDGWTVEAIAKFLEMDAEDVDAILEDAALPCQQVNDMVWVLVAGEGLHTQSSGQPAVVLALRSPEGADLATAMVGLTKLLHENPALWTLTPTPVGLDMGLVPPIRVELGVEFWPCRPRVPLSARRHY